MYTKYQLELYAYSQDLTTMIYKAYKKYGLYSPKHLILLQTRAIVWKLLDEIEGV